MNEPWMEQLRGLHLPPDPPLWPPAPGWWLLALLAGLLAWRALAAARRAMIRHQRRRAALVALERIRARAGAESAALLCGDVAVLLKRIAVARFPGDDVAALTGEPWLQFLERSGGGTAAFSDVRRALLDAPYQRCGDAYAQTDIEALLSCARTWVRTVA